MSDFTVGRVMVHDDANLAGNVHGGTILKMLEEAGGVVCMRHCNRAEEAQKCVVLLAHIDRTEFLQPVYIGDIVQIHAELKYTSNHSLHVQCTVYSENVLASSIRMTNRASLWYVAATVEKPHTILPVPQLVYNDAINQYKCEERYKALKKLRDEQKSSQNYSNDDMNHKEMRVLTPQLRMDTLKYSVEYSQSSFIRTLHPSDCDYYGFASGGSTLKKMDSLAGVVAFRHCKTNVVTAAVEAVDFHHQVKLGHLMTVTGRAVYTSNKSVDIEVIVDCEDIMAGTVYRSCSAIFTYVSLDKNNIPREVPPLQLINEAEKMRFEIGRQRYLRRKDLRKEEGNANSKFDGNSASSKKNGNEMSKTSQ